MSIVFLFFTTFGALSIFLIIWKYFRKSKQKDIKKIISFIKESYSLNSSAAITRDNKINIQLEYFREYPKIYQMFCSIALKIMQAGSQISLINFFCYSTALLLLSIMVLLLITKFNITLIILLGLIAGASPYIYIVKLSEKRKAILEEQLPLALDFLSRGLRAGHALTISISMAGKELPDPVGYELRKTYDEINYGIPFNIAMQNLALRINSQDYNFLVISLSIQRETGGNLTELLTNLAKTIRERIKLAGKVRTLSAESKFSGVMLLTMPFIMAFILFIISPNYISVLWTTDKGLNMISTGIFFMIIGAVWMSRIIKIKV